MLEEQDFEPAWQARGRAVDIPGVLVATETRLEGDTIGVAVRGELDLATAPALRRRLLELLALPISGVTVDLEGMAFIDSSGLEVLCEALRRADERGMTFALVRVPDQARQVLEITHLALSFGLASGWDGGPNGTESTAD